VLTRLTAIGLCTALAIVTAPGVLAQRAGPADSPLLTGYDSFHFLGQQNKASVVMLADVGIVPKPLAARIAKGITQVLADEGRPGARRSADYLQFEELLVKAAGPDASMLHSGRSRQDLGSTTDRLSQREALLNVYDTKMKARQKLHALASQHVDTVIPAYTHGVQAQPTSLAHYLLAFSAALDRDAERLKAAYGRINRSPLGAAALATSGFPVDRVRLATLLGFDDVVENSYDANHVSPADIKTEFAAALASSAIHIGQFVEDLHIQYHDPQPWFLLKEGELTGISSIMPQKRNPSALERLRGICSDVLGESQTVFMFAHNTSTGMSDYRSAQQLLEAAESARRMYDLFGRVVESLLVNPARALQEVDNDYATMTEVADTLQRVANVPFRIGHHFASEMTTYGRARNKRPKDLTYAELQTIYTDSTHGQKLPLTETQMKGTLDPQYVVAHRSGLGGSQPAEVKRMLSEEQKRSAAAGEWLSTQRRRLQEAERTLEQAFTALAAGATHDERP
jgi:argininosuccinate lyase